MYPCPVWLAWRRREDLYLIAVGGGALPEAHQWFAA
jgi:hypothetical protein